MPYNPDIKFDPNALWESSVARSMVHMMSEASKRDANIAAGFRKAPLSPHLVVPKVVERFLASVHSVSNRNEDAVAGAIDIVASGAKKSVKDAEFDIDNDFLDEIVDGLQRAMLLDNKKYDAARSEPDKRVFEISGEVGTRSHTEEFILGYLPDNCHDTEGNLIGQIFVGDDVTARDRAERRFNMFLIVLTFVVLVILFFQGSMDRFQVDVFNTQSARSATLARFGDTITEGIRQNVRGTLTETTGPLYQAYGWLQTFGIISAVQTAQYFNMTGTNVANMSTTTLAIYEGYSSMAYAWSAGFSAVLIVGVIAAFYFGNERAQEHRALSLVDQ